MMSANVKLVNVDISTLCREVLIDETKRNVEGGTYGTK